MQTTALNSASANGSRGQLRTGATITIDKPPERELAVELGVSRATLALEVLEMQGRVAVRHGDGVAVAGGGRRGGRPQPVPGQIGHFQCRLRPAPGATCRSVTPTVTGHGLGMMIHAMP